MLGTVHILLIEDNPADVDFFVQMLSTNQYRIYPENSYTVIVASTMDDAMRHIEEGTIEITVVDLLLPGTTPNDILALIERASSMLPVVALTTDDRIDIAIDAIKHGAQDYLVKNRASGDSIERAIRYAVERKVLSEEQARIRDELQRSNEELQQFAYVASHDLQEPLRMVMSYLALLNKKFGDELPPQAKEYMSIATEGSERMRQLVNDLLQFSRVDTQGRAIAAVDMNKVVNEVVNELRFGINDVNAEIVVGELPTVLADESQMKQLLTNLVSNAVKFHDGARPRIEVSSIRRWNEHVFSVRDNGIGIDPQYHDRLFKMFQRLHSMDEYPGTGIGLAISKKIVERHGGRIWVESDGASGSTFYFSIRGGLGKDR